MFNSVLSSLILYTKVSVTFLSVGVVGVAKSLLLKHEILKKLVT